MFERMIRCLVIFNHNDRVQASDLVNPQRCTRGSATGIRYLSKCAFQYSSQTTSVWHLKKNQYNPCPSIQAPQKKNSIIVLLRLAGEESRLRPATISPPRAGPRPLAETVQPFLKGQESHRDSAPILESKTRTKA